MTRQIPLLVLSALCSVALAGPAPQTTLPGAEGQELDQVQQEIARFENASKDFSGTVKHIVQQEYVAKRRVIMDKYQPQVDVLEKNQKSGRQDAVAQFEEFLAKYAADERWTPDAMFRLAELHFEKSNDEYLSATAQGAQTLPDYQKTVEIYRSLITRFPKYRLLDGAYYLLGWCLAEMNKEGEALQAMRGLVCANKYNPLDPPEKAKPTLGKFAPGAKASDLYQSCQPVRAQSRFLPEAWTRVGEFHFDSSELELAIAAYSRVLEFTDSPYYDKALYKLAWSYYRADAYPDAIKRFDQLVAYADQKKAQSGGAQEGSDLRTEAVQYLGVSFAEKDWGQGVPGDQVSGLDRVEKFYKGRDDNYVREVYAKLGDIYFDETEYFHAVEVYKRVLEKWPYHPGNPKLQDRVVMAFERQRDFQNALRERDALARNYTGGTTWAEHNRDNKEAMQVAGDLVELALVHGAVSHHTAAQEYKRLAAAQNPPDVKQIEQAFKEYSQAATAYQKYLAEYPNSKNGYEYSYAYAETLYYSNRFLDAAKQYEKVRDSNLDRKYLEDAAFAAVKSYENYLDAEAKAGRYSEPPLPADGKTAVPVTPLPIPDSVMALQRAYDTFVQKVPTSGRVAAIAYKAAEIDYRFRNWQGARPRLEKVVATYCKEDVGANAGTALLTTYTIEKNLDKLEEWAKKLRQANCGSVQLASKNEGVLKGLEKSVKFKKADQLFADKKYEDAAQAYVTLVDGDPRNDEADKALNNAAVAYENSNRFGAATRLYERIVTDYPSSKFLDEALFRTAVNYQKYFDFGKSVVSYLRLAEDKRFAASTHRIDSLYNAAVILENDQSYARSAELFRRYAQDRSVKPDDAADAFFRVGLNYAKQKDYGKARKAFLDFVRLYSGSAKQARRVPEAYFRIAGSYEGDPKSADDWYRRVISSATTLTAGSPEAEYPAHAAFILAEEKLPRVEKLKLSSKSSKAIAKAVTDFDAGLKQLIVEYGKILAYKRASWTLGAYFRTGYLAEAYSKALLGAPCPDEVKRLGGDSCDQYREGIEKQVSEYDDEAVKRYGVTLTEAGKLGVSNEWTKLARIRANAYKPDEFPLVKDERVDLQLENL